MHTSLAVKVVGVKTNLGKKNPEGRSGGSIKDSWEERKRDEGIERERKGRLETNLLL